jgi:cytochrome c553
VALFAPAPLLADDAGPTGEALYAQHCASCHGAQGEGTLADYPHALIGDRPLDQLATLIDRTMPQGEPDLLNGDDARKVSEYVFENFYSKDAQARNTPPRVELSRLTVRQYRNTLADLIGSFGEPNRWSDEHGLKAEYFKSRRFRKEDRAIERVDPQVRFDFGTASPDGEKLEADAFSIRWQGSILAPDTGDYEFIVRTDHATRLHVNDDQTPLIDAWVKSGDDTEYRANLFLVGGRAYPVRLEFSKAKQGVDDSDKQKEKPVVPASISLEWRPPHRAAEPIPQRFLSTQWNPNSFVSSIPIPPDDRSEGYERGSAVSKEWEEATTEGAIEAAAYMLANLRRLTNIKPEQPAEERDKGYRDFARKFVERAFRRPLDEALVQLYVDRPFEGSPDPETALKRVLLLTLKSPRFLYREVEGEPNDPYNVASRLSYGLWDAPPDRDLMKAAAENRLQGREQVAEQARRMVVDPRGRAKLREFFLQWLKVDQVQEVAKNPEVFPDFDPAIATDLRASLELFLEDIAWSEASDYRQLMLSEEVFLNGRLAKFYKADLPEDAPFQKVKLDPGQRAGLLSHPYLMAVFGYTEASSPIHRGVFLARNVMGRTIRPPQAAFSPLSPDLHPDLTTRERTIKQTGDPACQACHTLINGLGFALENFDTVGRFRADERGKPVDASANYFSTLGDEYVFSGARGLAQMVAESEEAHAALVQRLFQFLVKQPMRAFGPYTGAELTQSFASHEYNIRDLMVEIMATSALGPKSQESQSPPAE